MMRAAQELKYFHFWARWRAPGIHGPRSPARALRLADSGEASRGSFFWCTSSSAAPSSRCSQRRRGCREVFQRTTSRGESTPFSGCSRHCSRRYRSSWGFLSCRSEATAPEAVVRLTVSPGAGESSDDGEGAAIIGVEGPGPATSGRQASLCPSKGAGKPARSSLARELGLNHGDVPALARPGQSTSRSRSAGWSETPRARPWPASRRCLRCRADCRSALGDRTVHCSTRS